MASDFPPMTPFALAFAAEYKGFMRAQDIKGSQIAELLDRGEGYVSERVNGKRALDINDVDALATLAGGWSGIDLLMELTRRAETALNPGGAPEDGEAVHEPSGKHPPANPSRTRHATRTSTKQVEPRTSLRPPARDDLTDHFG